LAEDTAAPSSIPTTTLNDSAVAHYRYPDDLPSGANDKWVLFKLISRPSLIDSVGQRASQPTTLTTIVTQLPPSALKTDYSVNYEELELGSTVGAALQTVTPEKIAALRAQLSRASAMDVAKKALDAGKGVYDLLLGEARDTFGKILENTGFENATEIIDRANRNTINQRVEVLFKNVEFRTHTFNYTFMPRSSREADSLRDILSIFKLGMLPGFAAQTLSSGTVPDVLFSFPYEWEIKFSPNHAKNTFQIQNSVLKDLQIDYATAGHVAFFKDGHPVSTTVTMTFRETVLLTRDQYSQQINEKNGFVADATNPNRRTYRF
jgi:hypothetical protein